MTRFFFAPMCLEEGESFRRFPARASVSPARLLEVMEAEKEIAWKHEVRNVFNRRVERLSREIWNLRVKNQRFVLCEECEHTLGMHDDMGNGPCCACRCTKPVYIHDIEGVIA